MRDKPYYSVRTGKNPNGVSFSLDMMKRLFLGLYNGLSHKGYFQEAFGKECVDDPDLSGTLGSDPNLAMYRILKKDNLWPIWSKIQGYSEDDLFDIIEFLYDYVSEGSGGFNHTWNNCGYHFDKFDREAGRIEYRRQVNDLLREYGAGYELSMEGEITELPEEGLAPLLDAPLPNHDPERVEDRVQGAIRKFRSRHSSADDRRDAVRDLADVLEYLRPQVKEVLASKDESALFNIANNFGIRHNNAQQKTDYDKRIWLSWMFHFYLATIHASLRLIEKKTSQREAN